MDKDTNKKSKPTKSYKSTAEKKKTPAQILADSRDARINRMNQLRRNKMNNFFSKRRGLIDSDGNSSIDISRNKSMTLANISQYVDLNSYKIPPKICALIALNNDANLDSMINGFDKVITENQGPNDTKNKFICNNYVTYVIPNKLYKGKRHRNAERMA